MMSNDRGISAFPDGDKLFSWIATVTGPGETVYEGVPSLLQFVNRKHPVTRLLVW